jgi:hypothetical protein
MHLPGALHDNIYLLQRHNIGPCLFDDLGKTLYIVDPVISLTVVDIVTKNTKSILILLGKCGRKNKKAGNKQQKKTPEYHIGNIALLVKKWK